MTSDSGSRQFTDVRMKGFSGRSTVEEALAWVNSRRPVLADLPRESVSLNSAFGRVLATDVFSQVNVPGFRRSMMDGFAVRAEESQGASPYNPLVFRVVGTCLPGVAFAGQMPPGTVVRIMTGAPMPAEADAVLPFEHAEVHRDSAGHDSDSTGHDNYTTEHDSDTVHALENVTTGKNVAEIGEDIRQGALVLRAGRRIRPQDIGVLSSIGIDQVPVIRRPRVHIVITGGELLPPGSIPSGYQIVDSNGPMLQALVSRDGGIPSVSATRDDSAENILRQMQQPADVILISGGSSVGQEDHAPRLLAKHGHLAIHGIAMRPSSPAGMGHLNRVPVFLLPGNPVSCLCAYDFFAGRLIRMLSGQSEDWPYPAVELPLQRKITSIPGRVDYARVRIDDNHAVPVAISGASVLSSTTLADGFIIIPGDCEGYPAGHPVTVRLYQH